MKEWSQGTKHEEQGSRVADPTLQLAKRSAGSFGWDSGNNGLLA